ncbi:MAG: DEAD/DEAH box helicase [Muribaculaceae bacterium]|nr:DEAD/DEAH box helicase [Muribaculaceae bacterium]
MTENLDFLKRLKPTGNPSAKIPDFLFEVIPEAGNLFLHTVDTQKRRPVDVMPESYGGAPGRMLSFMAGVAGYRFRSGNNFDLYSDTVAVTRLAECKNVVIRGRDTILKPISHAVARVMLSIRPKEDQPDILVPSLSLRYADGSFSDDFLVLSDTVVSDYERFVYIDSIGDNYSQLSVFEHEFPADALADYLAIFLTYVHNVSIEILGQRLVFGDTVRCEPAIVIEKMDVDRALYLSACSLPPGEDSKMIGGLRPGYLVRIGDSGIITAYPLDYLDNRKLTLGLYEKILTFAPNRTEAKYVYTDSSIIIVPEATASAFLLQGLPAMLRDYRIIGLDRIKDYKLRPVTPRLNIRFTSGIDYLEGAADIQLEEQTFTIRDILEQYRANKYVALSDGSRAVIDDRFIRRIERIFGSRMKDDRVRLSFFDLPEIEQFLDGSDNEVLRRPREFYAGFNALPAKKIDLPRIKASLRNYQADGVRWLDYLYDNGMGGCLADDMGLGKTLQIICLVEKHLADSDRPFLIVMPRSLIFNWESEFRKFAPHIDVTVYYGQGRDFAEAASHKVILTTYAIVRNDIETLRDMEFDTVVLDESQTVKNLEALQTKAVASLKAPHRFAMSGTPLENNLSELYSLFRFINPGMFGSFDDFQSRYLNPIQNAHDDDAVKSLRRKIFPFMLRRLKRDVLTDLPDRIDDTIYVDMDDAQARYYEQRRKYYLDKMRDTIREDGLVKAQFVMLQAMNELRRIASVPESLTDGSITSPKLELLIDRISQAVENGHKVVVFFNFIAGVELLAERLNAIGINTETMTGATRNRKEIVNSFQNSEDLKVLIMTLKTGGVGLNLTAADIVFIVEPWWNRAAQEQAVNRLHRIGQKGTVFSYSLISRNTIEEKIEQLQQMKADLFNDVIASDESTSKKLTEEDINFILS